MTDATDAEFDTVAEWTAQIALDLGPDYYVPAGCRGSGSPPALDWLIDGMCLERGATLLDCGAGVGGPAAYAARSRGALPILVEPAQGACRAATKLFGYPVMRAVGSTLPVADSSVDAAWALGVLCTTPQQQELLDELRRVVRPGGRIGLLVFVAQRDIPSSQSDGNYFPTPSRLMALVERASLRLEQWLSTANLPAIPGSWNERMDVIDKALGDRYGKTEAWRLAERQSSRIGGLLEEEALTGALLILRRGSTTAQADSPCR
jgi:SAM-dependent methyltransferase